MSDNILSLDIGRKRIGVARANIIARLPEPLITLNNDNSFLSNLEKILGEYPSEYLVVGLPRSLNGQETAQTAYTKEFVAKNLKSYNVIWQDETLSTISAQDSGPGPHGIDADAACVILEDYFKEN